MPFMDGFEATKAIRAFLYEMNIHQPIISAVTGLTQEPFLSKCLACGMNQVASKPLKLEVIRDLMIKMNYMDEEEE